MDANWLLRWLAEVKAVRDTKQMAALRIVSQLSPDENKQNKKTEKKTDGELILHPLDLHFTGLNRHPFNLNE